MYKESEKIELKSTFGEWKEIIISLTSFANKSGGTVIVGISDDMQPLGLSLGKDTIEDFLNKLKNHTDPVLYPSVSIKTYGIGEIVEISIPESDYKPVFCFEKAYIRVGKTNQKISTQELKELIKRYEPTNFDEQILRFLVPLNEFEEKHIKNLDSVLTNAEYLCYTKENKYFPNAIVKAARFKGSNMATFLANQDFQGNITDMADQLLEFIKRNINKKFVIKGEAKHTEVWDYPLLALREAILNALVHRDYSDPGNIQVRIFDDHLEILSPGLLPKALDMKKIFTASRSIPRNKKIVSIFHKMGLIEQWGSGFHRMLEACKENKNPQPVLNEVAGAFVISFFKNEGTNEGVNEGVNEGTNEGINEGIKILEKTVFLYPGLRVQQLAKKLNQPPKTIERWLKILKDASTIEFRGSNKTGGYYKKE